MKLNTRIAVALLVLALPHLCARASDPAYPRDQRARMGQFERHALDKADASYNARNYDQAQSLYEAYIQEFPKSKAVPYCYFRKARCVHLGEGQMDGIKAYETFLDYFPALIEYAVPALHYIGECYLEMHDTLKAMDTWREMADDPDYKKHELSGYASRRLADALFKSHKDAEGIKRLRSTSVDYRYINPDQARYTINWYVAHFIRAQPDEPNLREFYKAVGSFDQNPRKIEKDADVTTDQQYWKSIWERVWAESGNFNDLQVKEKKAYFKYWADILAGYNDRFKDWQEFQEQVVKLNEAAKPAE